MFRTISSEEPAQTGPSSTISHAAVRPVISDVRRNCEITRMPNSQIADFLAVRFLHFADAAFSRGRGTPFVAKQRLSSIQPFKGVVLAGARSEAVVISSTFKPRLCTKAKTTAENSLKWSMWCALTRIVFVQVIPQKLGVTKRLLTSLVFLLTPLSERASCPSYLLHV